MSGIFISYRRNDNRDAARLVQSNIREYFEKPRLWAGIGPKRAKLFFDVDAIDAGIDFHDLITERVKKCKVMLVIIGKAWLEKDSKGKYRIQDADDFVRLEIGAALRLGKTVVPVLVDGASMPNSKHLPDDVKALAERNAVEIDPGSNFESTMSRLRADIASVFRMEWLGIEAAGIASAFAVIALLIFTFASPQFEPNSIVVQPEYRSGSTYFLEVNTLRLDKCEQLADGDGIEPVINDACEEPVDFVASLNGSEFESQIPLDTSANVLRVHTPGEDGIMLESLPPENAVISTRNWAITVEQDDLEYRLAGKIVEKRAYKVQLNRIKVHSDGDTSRIPPDNGEGELSWDFSANGKTIDENPRANFGNGDEITISKSQEFVLPVDGSVELRGFVVETDIASPDDKIGENDMLTVSLDGDLSGEFSLRPNSGGKLDVEAVFTVEPM